MLTQTENPAVLKTVDNVLKGIQGLFGGGGKKGKSEPDAQGSGEKPQK